MLIQFRCPKCKATQIRGTESTEPYDAAGDGTNKYRCGSCGSLIDGDAVQAGRFDIAGSETDRDRLTRRLRRSYDRRQPEFSQPSVGNAEPMSNECTKVVPYRCTNCHALLERQQPSDELLSVQDRHNYICSVCGVSMPAKEIESGALDVQTELPPCGELLGSGPHDFRDILSYLRSTHRANHVYRGQTKVWPGPLVPSLYRGRVLEQRIDVPKNLRLRELGRVFHSVSADVSVTSDLSFIRRARFNAQLVQVFGYPFGSMLAQQCGVASEGLDVSHDPDVAAFFAVFDFVAGSFTRDGTGAIYRICLPETQAGNKDLCTASFFDCPSVVSAFVVFCQLRRAATWEEALDSFIEYGYKSAMTPGSSHPLQLLALPSEEVLRCRVVQQRAGLLLPDVVLPKEYGQALRKPPPGKSDWDGPLLIEDVSLRDGVEVFRFQHDDRNKYYVPHSPEVLFPATDGVTKLLRSFFVVNPKMRFMTEFGIFGEENGDLIR